MEVKITKKTRFRRKCKLVFYVLIFIVFGYVIIWVWNVDFKKLRRKLERWGIAEVERKQKKGSGSEDLGFRLIITVMFGIGIFARSWRTVKVISYLNGDEIEGVYRFEIGNNEQIETLVKGEGKGSLEIEVMVRDRDLFRIKDRMVEFKVEFEDTTKGEFIEDTFDVSIERSKADTIFRIKEQGQWESFLRIRPISKFEERLQGVVILKGIAKGRIKFPTKVEKAEKGVILAVEG